MKPDFTEKRAFEPTESHFDWVREARKEMKANGAEYVRESEDFVEDSRVTTVLVEGWRAVPDVAALPEPEF